MTLITSSSWNTVASEIKNVRDDARRRFFSEYGKPIKSLGDLNIAPSGQIEVVQKIAQTANIQSISSAEDSIQSALAAMMVVGLGAGGPMAAMGKTKFDCRNMVVPALMSHFTDPFDDV